MKNLIDTLQSLYDTTFQSEIDSVFYQSIHNYIDFIVKTPELSALIKKESANLKSKHKEIRNDPSLQQTNKDDLILRNELLSFYRNYMHLYAKIYLPLEDQKNGVDMSLEDKELLYYFKGVENVSEKDRQFLERSFKYKHEMSEKYLKDFHTKFLPLIEKVEVKDTIPKRKPIITFDTEKSILTINGKQVMITLKNDKTDGHYVLEYLFEFGIEEPADYVDILKSKFIGDKKNNMSMYRACNDINKKVSEQANISNFLDIHSGITGWVQVNSEFR